MPSGPRRVLVYGWYHQDNLGDDLFVEAFKKLFPEFEFTFSNFLTRSQVRRCDAVFFGGGSFLDNPVRGEAGIVEAVAKRKVLYVGVGLETSFDPDHVRLMKRSKMVAARSRHEAFEGALKIPDLVYSLSGDRAAARKKRLLFLPNVAVVPTRKDPQWKHAAWGYFKSECSQFLDESVDAGYEVSLLPMCRSSKMDDGWAAAELVSQMEYRERSLILSDSPKTASESIALFSSYSAVVTQRFHGIVLAEMSGVRCVAIAHHDKLATSGAGCTSIPYYGVTKVALRSALEAARPAGPRKDDDEALSVMCKTVREIVQG